LGGLSHSLAQWPGLPQLKHSDPVTVVTARASAVRVDARSCAASLKGCLPLMFAMHIVGMGKICRVSVMNWCCDWSVMLEIDIAPHFCSIEYVAVVRCSTSQWRQIHF
jgi:hypothetical protein